MLKKKKKKKQRELGRDWRRKKKWSQYGTPKGDTKIVNNEL